MARGRKTVTIRDVAEDAGVSLQTVSRVVNDGPNVRPQLRDKVRASIDRLGYVPSLAAQRMSGSRSYIILAINDRERTLADWRERRGTDWVDQMLLGGILTCSKHGLPDDGGIDRHPFRPCRARIGRGDLGTPA